MSGLGVSPHSLVVGGVPMSVRGLEGADLDQLHSLTLSVSFSTTKAEQRILLDHCTDHSVGAFTEDGNLLSECTYIHMHYLYQLILYYLHACMLSLLLMNVRWLQPGILA